METILFEVILIELKNQKYELCVHILYELCDHILYGFASSKYVVWTQGHLGIIMKVHKIFRKSNMQNVVGFLKNYFVMLQFQDTFFSNHKIRKDYILGILCLLFKPQGSNCTCHNCQHASYICLQGNSINRCAFRFVASTQFATKSTKYGD